MHGDVRSPVEHRRLNLFYKDPFAADHVQWRLGVPIAGRFDNDELDGVTHAVFNKLTAHIVSLPEREFAAPSGDTHVSVEVEEIAQRAREPLAPKAGCRLFQAHRGRVQELGEYSSSDVFDSFALL